MKFTEFEEKFTEDMAQSLNKGLTLLSFADNFKCDIRTLTEIAAGDTFAISHSLKKTPQYRIILKQEGGQYITDGDNEQWNDKVIYLKNNGTVILRKLTVLIM